MCWGDARREIVRRFLLFLLKWFQMSRGLFLESALEWIIGRFTEAAVFNSRIANDVGTQQAVLRIPN